MSDASTAELEADEPYRSAVPSDFSYKHDAKHSSTIVVAEIGGDPVDDIILEQVHALLTKKDFGLYLL